MKKIIFIFTMLLCCQIFSQDTNIVKYVPLKIGNIWVYGGQFGELRAVVSSSQVVNGHIYYNITYTGDQTICSGSGYCNPYPNSFRIDSVTGNVMVQGSGCAWQNGILFDSLKKRTGDLPASCNFSICYDTSAFGIFGSARSTKNFGI